MVASSILVAPATLPKAGDSHKESPASFFPHSAMTEFLKIASPAILQGVAEFLPVSSSGHLVVVQDLLHLNSPGNTLEIALHAGTLLSICVFYGASISAIAGGMLRGRRAALRYALALFVSMIPCGIAFAVLGDWLEQTFDKPWVVGPMWLFTAVLMFTLPRSREGEVGDGGPKVAIPPEVPLKAALITGIGQAVAMLPGVSRSGTTIWVARRCGLSAKDAARFSFLMSLPVIGGATLLTLAKLGSETDAAAAATGTPGWMLAAGATISAVVGYISLAVLMRMLRRGRFWVFGVYCAIVGTVTTLWYLAH